MTSQMGSRMELSLADEVFLAHFDLTTGLEAAWPRWAGARPLVDRAPVAAVIAELIEGKFVVSVSTGTTKPALARMGMDDSRPELSVTERAPSDPLLLSAWEQIAQEHTPRKLSRHLARLRIDMRSPRPSGTLLTAAGLAAARESREELNSWVASDDVPVPSTERVMIARPAQPTSPLSTRSRRLAVLVQAGDLRQRMWPDREANSKTNGLLSIARDEALHDGDPAWETILQELRLLNAPSS